MVKVVGIKFKNGGKLYYFAPREGETYARNMPVVVETARGTEYAWVAHPEKEIEESEIVTPLKPIVRIATQKDRDFYAACEAKKPQAIRTCKEKIKEHGLEMKLVDCEHAFDGSKIVFYFTAAARVDFRELVKDLAATFHTRIELRQVGTRDETKYLGGIAPCGRVCCCAGNMPEFKKVSVRMAKAQNLSLNPGKISGLCGRLMCCLGYEMEHYTEAAKKLPKVGSEVGTPDGKATVASLNMLKMEVRVKQEDGAGGWVFKDFPASELKYKRNNAQPQNEEEDDEEETE
ncbi:MAG: stage 0 sporulation family protein [Clostridia bacterium]|nr:stage 0 sporulation family protein [Clostridia bacterium]